MREMKLDLLPNENPIKKRPHMLSHKYKDIVKNEINNMLKEGIIYPINQSELDSPMVIQPKKHDPKKLKVCVDFRWLNRVTLTDPFPTPFTGEIINEVEGHECYSFTDKFSRYNQVPIAKEDQHKTTFFYEFGSSAYIFMPFGLKNSPIVFYTIVIKSFQEYLYKTMAFYFNDWTIYSLLKEHVKWIKLMLEICREI